MITKDRLVTRPEVLDADFQPSEIAHREGQLDHLKHILEDVRKGYRVDGAFLYGPTGTGKTVTANHIVDRLTNNADDVVATHVDCWGDGYSDMLHRLLEGYDEDIVHHENTPARKLQSVFNQNVTKPYVVILDEADQLEDAKILYKLHENPNVTMLLIANADDEFFDHLDTRVYSRLRQYPDIKFPKYEPHQLVSILGDRVEAGVQPGAVPDERLREIADVADDDARIAIGILANAVKEADSRGLEAVTKDVIMDVVPETKQDILALSYSKLTARQRKLYEILVEQGEQQIGEIHDHYTERTGDSITKKTLRKDLKKMNHYYVVAFDGDNKGRTYEATTDRLLGKPTDQ